MADLSQRLLLIRFNDPRDTQHAERAKAYRECKKRKAERAAVGR